MYINDPKLAEHVIVAAPAEDIVDWIVERERSATAASARMNGQSSSNPYHEALSCIERCYALARAIQRESDNRGELAPLLTLLHRELDATHKALKVDRLSLVYKANGNACG
jgi:hypothetical protein